MAGFEGGACEVIENSAVLPQNGAVSAPHGGARGIDGSLVHQLPGQTGDVDRAGDVDGTSAGRDATGEIQGLHGQRLGGEDTRVVALDPTVEDQVGDAGRDAQLGN